ncbi:endonuclease/exonuclease/phosphatase family protein [Methylovulum psychrotolerans]|uniref:endonuclease/exonuclease/phosphatase family protein n=1 Tax=Methylovulum psychrotolerans TaxID=1704499 RepID=UPI001BFF130E|nr:endonuclease/exonuclease/phosphatase family protein [Methylovulum psychrotolerans]MBT9100052.1 endonuclease/exonuclease/phosphatase family protein [Methylovulum psychrotolerans]
MAFAVPVRHYKPFLFEGCPLVWLKRIAVSLVVLVVAVFAVLRYQGVQRLAAYTGGGLARPLPDAARWAGQSCTVAPMQVLSYNVMYGSAFIEAMAARFKHGETGKGELPWSVRLPEIRARIAEYNADLIGLQEMGTAADVAMIVPPEQYSLVSYRQGSVEYADSALLYRTARFEQLDAGQLWLGNDPELPMSLGFRRLSMIRYVNWVLLRDKASGFTFLYANTHFDNAGVNKDPSSLLFRARVAGLAKQMPVIVTGDFNTTAQEARYQHIIGANVQPPLLANAYSLAHNPPVPPQLHPDKRIDHIFVGGPCYVEADNWLLDTRPLQNGLPMSDHDLLTAQVRFF